MLIVIILVGALVMASGIIGFAGIVNLIASQGFDDYRCLALIYISASLTLLMLAIYIAIANC